MFEKVIVEKNSRKGNFWDVLVVDENGPYINKIKTAVAYVEAYQAKLAAEKRIGTGKLAVRRKPLITI